MKFLNTTKCNLGCMYATFVLVCGFLLFGLPYYGGLKGFTNHFPNTARLGTKLTGDEFIIQWPDNSYSASGVRGTKKPLESELKDPHLCILVSTYKPHALKLVSMLTSFSVSEYPYMKAILLDTDEKIDSTPWMKDVAKAVNGIFEKEYVVTANLTQRDMMQKYTETTTGVKSDYGYILTDVIISDLLKKRDLATEHNDSKPECDYFMTTNGDNLYGPGMIPALLYYLRQGYDIVGFDFTSRYAAGPIPAHFPDRIFKLDRKDQQVDWEPIRKTHRSI